MELKDFIKQTIVQIVDGVVEAQSSIRDKGANINPVNFRFTKDGQQNHSKFAIPQDIVFDIGLTSSEKNGSSEGIGVFLGTINLGKKSEDVAETVAVTKVKFTVPLALPAGIDCYEAGVTKVRLDGL